MAEKVKLLLETKNGRHDKVNLLTDYSKDKETPSLSYSFEVTDCNCMQDPQSHGTNATRNLIRKPSHLSWTTINSIDCVVALATTRLLQWNAIGFMAHWQQLKPFLRRMQSGYVGVFNPFKIVG